MNDQLALKPVLAVMERYVRLGIITGKNISQELQGPEVKPAHFGVEACPHLRLGREGVCSQLPDASLCEHGICLILSFVVHE